MTKSRSIQITSGAALGYAVTVLDQMASALRTNKDGVEWADFIQNISDDIVDLLDTFDPNGITR